MKRLLFSIYTSLLVRLQKQNVGMKFFNFTLVSLIISVLVFCSCNEPTILGADLVDGERGDIQVVDTFKISMETIEGDTVIGFNSAFVNYSNYLLGDFEDPVFGKSNASLYFRIGGPGFYPGFDTIARPDSIVLILPYDTAGFYGNVNQSFSFDLFEISERITGDAVYNTDTTLATNPMALNSFQFIPNGIDSLDIIESNIEDREESLKLPPHLRIRLDDSFMDRIVNTDSLTYESDSIFLEIFKGFHMVANTTTNGMLSFNLVDPSAGIDFYYHKTDSAFEKFHFQFNRLIVPSYSQDVTGSPIEPFINNQSSEDSLFFVQGLKGLGVKMELPDITSLGDVIINRAEIELTTFSLPGDDINLYSPTEQLILSYASDGDQNSRTPIDDINFAGSSIENIQEWFGGNVTGSSGNVQTYTMSIASHLQRVLEGEADNILYLQPYLRAQSATRAAFKGSRAKENPAKLRIFYTETTK